MTRDGHLDELDLARLDGDERARDPAFFLAADAHLAGCARCRDALAARRAEDATVAMLVAPAVVARATSVARRGVRARVLAVTAGVLALAAVAFIATRPPAPSPAGDDDLTVKGGALYFEVQVNDGTRTRVVADGDRIRPGERAAFGVRSAHGGHLLIFGWDHTTRAYPLWPTSDPRLPAVAGELAASATLVPLPITVRFDDAPGDETFAALLCPAPFSLADIVPGGLVTVPPTRPGCSTATIVLRRAP